MDGRPDKLRVVLEAKYYPNTAHHPIELKKPLARITRSLTVDAIPKIPADIKNEALSATADKSTDFGSRGARKSKNESQGDGLQPNRSLVFHVYTVWLFTVNDLKSIVLPQTIFGLASALSGSSLTTNESPSLFVVLPRLPLLLIWTYLNVLIFDVSNQRLSPSIIEDSVNKSWRPLPARRLTPAEARRFLLALLPMVSIVTYFIGGLRETVAMIVLTWMYNDLSGADEHYAVRNAINALGFICYAAGTTIVAAGPGQHGLNENAPVWLTIVGAVVFTTLQMQDLPDVHGDAERGRKTFPLVAGQEISRWSVAAPVVFWSLLCPAYWELGIGGFALCGLPGALLAWRVMKYRTVKADKVSWKLWCLWSVTLYMLPLCADYSIFERAYDNLPSLKVSS